MLVEKLERSALPKSLVSQRGGDDDNDFVELARLYKQLNAPLGSIGLNSLALATRSIKGADTTYAWYLSTIGPIVTARDALAQEIKTALDAAAFGNKSLRGFGADVLIRRAKALINKVEDLAERDRRF